MKKKQTGIVEKLYDILLKFINLSFILQTLPNRFFFSEIYNKFCFDLQI